MLSEEEEINRLIDEAADEYVPFEEILKQNNITFEEALSAAEGEKEHFFDTQQMAYTAMIYQVYAIM